ncbi:MAG: putative peptidase [Verrucomicrobiales bacterium]|jgi:predicted peptidase
MGLAWEALVTVKGRYRIDPNRCYVGGVSGGGVSSTMINYLRPEFFKGAVNIGRGALLEKHTIEKAVKVNGNQGYAAGQTYPPFLPHLTGMAPV